jgi:hypothetical protein
VAALALALSLVSGVFSAIGVGLVAGAGILLIFGSPLCYPDIAAVKVALHDVGLEAPNLARPRRGANSFRRKATADSRRRRNDTCFGV